MVKTNHIAALGTIEIFMYTFLLLYVYTVSVM